jgi:hypothetical protein
MNSIPKQTVSRIRLATISVEIQINERAANFLRGVQGPIAIISVVGLFRSGKSTLLRWLLGLPVGYKGGFDVGHKGQAKTKGLWISLKTVRRRKKSGQDVNLLFVDVEGFDDPKKYGNDINVTLYLLALLTSSHTILNCTKQIDYSVIEKLGLV